MHNKLGRALGKTRPGRYSPRITDVHGCLSKVQEAFELDRTADNEGISAVFIGKDNILRKRVEVSKTSFKFVASSVNLWKAEFLQLKKINQCFYYY